MKATYISGHYQHIEIIRGNTAAYDLNEIKFINPISLRLRILEYQGLNLGQETGYND
jgi:hypothetical protein